MNKENNEIGKATATSEEDSYSALEYESLRDNALEMARVLREIDFELKTAAMTDMREECGYSPQMLLANLCKIMYSCYANFKDKTAF